ncbi:MAG: SDR family NAD(P)-dependent oxidoreductase [Enterobacterales bacterium]|nr:SDR family NAD(P)-dependent oxidoreductase [Enterobacterales bacterium]
MLTFENHDLSVAIIGASGAIGGAFVRHYAKQDRVGQVLAFSRTTYDWQNDKVKPVILDITDEQSIKSAAQHLENQSLDIIIVATGLLHQDTLQPEKRLADLASDSLEQLFKVNTIAPALLLKHLIPKLRRKTKTVFAVLSARVGSISDNRLGGWYGYRASKAALNMLIKSTAIELGRTRKQMFIVGLHPGTVDSSLSKPFQRNVPEGKLFTPEQSAGYLAQVLENLKDDDSGQLFAWDGEKIPF